MYKYVFPYLFRIKTLFLVSLLIMFYGVFTIMNLNIFFSIMIFFFNVNQKK